MSLNPIRIIDVDISCRLFRTTPP